MKNHDQMDSLPALGGTLHKEPLGLSAMDKCQIDYCKNSEGQAFFDAGFNRSHPQESLAREAFAAWRNFDAVP